MAKTNKKKQAMEDAPKEAEAKKKAEDVLPVGSAVVEDDAADDDEEQEEAEDGDAPVAPGPEGKPALLPDARSTTTAAQRPENELRVEWNTAVANLALAEGDVRRWGVIVNDPLMKALLLRFKAKEESLKEELVALDKGDLLTKQADIRARRWVVAELSVTAFDAALRKAQQALAEVEKGIGPLFLAKFKGSVTGDVSEDQKQAALARVAAKAEATKQELATASA